jgi:hypothetical protein
MGVKPLSTASVQFLLRDTEIDIWRAAVTISGLAGTTYIDKTEAGRRERQTQALVTIGAETDRVYLDTPGRCVTEDRGWRRNIVVEKAGAASTVVWNPWAEKGRGDLGPGRPRPARHGLRRDREHRRRRGTASRRWRAPDVNGDLSGCRNLTSSKRPASGVQ